MRRRQHILPAVLVALVLAGCTSSRGAEVGTATAVPVATEPRADASLPDLVDRVAPSVVTIVTEDGLGSGVVFRDGGVIVTNSHVVGDRTDVRVVLADGRSVPGTVVGSDPATDVAVVKAQQQDLPVAGFEPALPRRGAFVVAIGSPLGLANTVTTGVVSGLHRRIPGTVQEYAGAAGLIQTDAAISPGNSGGALLNGSGKVVGVNEAYIPPQSGAVALGFAIPAATVLQVADRLLSGATMTHPYLGLTPDRLTAPLANSLKLPNLEGVLVRETAVGGPAAAAGIVTGDVVTALNAQKTGDLDAFVAAVSRTGPGDRVSVTLLRAGAQTSVTVVIGTVPARSR